MSKTELLIPQLQIILLAIFFYVRSVARPQIIKVTPNSYFPFHCPTMMVLCPEHIWNPIFFFFNIFPFLLWFKLPSSLPDSLPQ